MFRIDDDEVVDATMHGNAARFINHSCEVSFGTYNYSKEFQLIIISFKSISTAVFIMCTHIF